MGARIEQRGSNVKTETQLSVPDWVQKRKRGRREKYRFGEIAVGTSLIVPVAEQSCKYSSFRVMVHKAARDLGRTFHTRQREDGAFEVWREK